MIYVRKENRDGVMILHCRETIQDKTKSWEFDETYVHPSFFIYSLFDRWLTIDEVRHAEKKKSDTALKQAAGIYTLKASGNS